MVNGEKLLNNCIRNQYFCLSIVTLRCIMINTNTANYNKKRLKTKIGLRKNLSWQSLNMQSKSKIGGVLRTSNYVTLETSYLCFHNNSFFRFIDICLHFSTLFLQPLQHIISFEFQYLLNKTVHYNSEPTPCSI